MTTFGRDAPIDVLAELSAGDRKILQSLARRLRFPAAAFVYAEGDPARHFYIIESGRVRVFYSSSARQEPMVSHRGPGNLFGISHLVQGGRRVTSARTVEASLILEIANEDLTEIARCLPILASGLIRALALRLRNVLALVGPVAAWPVHLRVANFLLAHHNREGRRPALVNHGWTPERIADLLGCTPRAVTDALNAFARSRWIRVERKRIFLLDPLALKRLLVAGLDADPNGPSLRPASETQAPRQHLAESTIPSHYNPRSRSG